MTVATRTPPATVAGSVILNLFLGYVALIPLVFLWGALQSSVFSDLGWSLGSSAVKDDQVGLAYVLSLVLLVPILAGFGAANLLLRPRWSITAGRYWALVTFLVLLPLLLTLAANVIWGDSAPSPFAPFT